MTITASVKSCDFWTPFYGVHRHYSQLCKPGLYAVIALNPELARMQGAKSAHVNCVVDDFGNLVGVAA